MTTDEFVSAVNAARRKSAGQWYQFVGEVNGKSVAIKAFNTWLQIFRIDGVEHWSGMDIPVSEFIANLKAQFTV